MGLTYERVRFQAMGSPCAVHMHTRSRAEATRIADRAVAEVRRLEAKYSRFTDDSLTAEINRAAGTGRAIEVDSETALLLDYADTCHAQSAGRFDLTAGVLRRAWNFKSGRLPSQDELDSLLQLVGWDHVLWEDGLLALPLAGMELDFGGFVKEYAVDRVAALCREAGLAHGLVDLGGDLAVIGPRPGGIPWQVGIRDPLRPERAIARVAIASGAIATSGDYERGMVIDGRRYTHVLDPRTGWPVDGLRSVSALAPHCLVAGSASTFAMLFGAEEGPNWLDELGLPNLRIDSAAEVSGSLARFALPHDAATPLTPIPSPPGRSTAPVGP